MGLILILNIYVDVMFDSLFIFDVGNNFYDAQCLLVLLLKFVRQAKTSFVLINVFLLKYWILIFPPLFCWANSYGQVLLKI